MCAQNAAWLNVPDKKTLAQPPPPAPHVQVVILKYLCVAGELVCGMCSQTGLSGVKSKIIKPSWELLLLVSINLNLCFCLDPVGPKQPIGSNSHFICHHGATVTGTQEDQTQKG